jgi:hypothetical protein
MYVACWVQSCFFFSSSSFWFLCLKMISFRIAWVEMGEDERPEEPVITMVEKISLASSADGGTANRQRRTQKCHRRSGPLLQQRRRQYQALPVKRKKTDDSEPDKLPERPKKLRRAFTLCSSSQLLFYHHGISQTGGGRAQIKFSFETYCSSFFSGSCCCCCWAWSGCWPSKYFWPSSGAAPA